LFSFNFFPPQGLGRTLEFLGWYKQSLIQFPDRFLQSPDGEPLILSSIDLALMPLEAPPQDATESAPSKGRLVQTKEAEDEPCFASGNSLAEARIDDGETKTEDGKERRGDELALNYAESALSRTRSSSSSESFESGDNSSNKIVRSGAPARTGRSLLLLLPRRKPQSRHFKKPKKIAALAIKSTHKRIRIISQGGVNLCPPQQGAPENIFVVRAKIIVMSWKFRRTDVPRSILSFPLSSCSNDF
jgi:hypothetical protein